MTCNQTGFPYPPTGATCACGAPALQDGRCMACQIIAKQPAMAPGERRMDDGRMGGIPAVCDLACMCVGSRYVPEGAPCRCAITERFLRNYGHDDEGKLPALTIAQREWCLKEIARVEGYDRTDYEHDRDHDLARGVLLAWQDYCRDKGLM